MSSIEKLLGFSTHKIKLLSVNFEHLLEDLKGDFRQLIGIEDSTMQYPQVLDATVKVRKEM